MARYLTGYPGLRYLGIDVVPDLLDRAREQCGRDDWVFQETTGFSIPVGDDEADFVTFFGLHPPVARADFSLFAGCVSCAQARRAGDFLFLEFVSPSQQGLFRKMVENVDRRTALSMFFDRPAIEFWAREPQFQVVDILDGHKDHIAKQQGELYLDGREVQRPLMLGQTVYVLRKAA